MKYCSKCTIFCSSGRHGKNVVKRRIFSVVSYNNADRARSVDRDFAIGRWTGCHEGGEAGREVRTAAGEKQTSAGVWAEYDGIRGEWYAEHRGVATTAFRSKS